MGCYGRAVKRAVRLTAEQTHLPPCPVSNVKRLRQSVHAAYLNVWHKIELCCIIFCTA